MRYLIYYEGTPFYTQWFDPENNFIEGMVVFDLGFEKFTIDGKTWQSIKQNHL